MRRGLYILILAVSGLKAAQPLDEKQLFDRVADAVVTIKHLDRNGDQEGIGTGFVIDSAGRVATSLHVIGEARRVEIILQDGSKYEPTSILGWDRT
ncbi:MAG: serine protease, partial [Verrucomicrobia bacterium]|nr:serine protease [Verrucomicrobiota bacterium]